MWLSHVYMPHSLLAITLCVFVCVFICRQRRHVQSSLCQEGLFSNNSLTDVELINCVLLKIQIAVIYQLIQTKALNWHGSFLSELQE